MKVHATKCTLLFLFLFLSACEKKPTPEYIYRKSDEYFFTPPLSQAKERPPYPWEQPDVGGFPRITKEFFRCHGNPLNPVREKKRDGKDSFYYRDCQGSHGLPLLDGREFVYPILLDLLNHIQKTLAKQVIITTGHKCPTHNAYSDYSSYSYGSKHMIGAEADFYVEGVAPEKIIAVLQEHFPKPFQRYTKGNLNISTPAWYNDEVFIKLYLPHEGRDEDNQHSHPYISIQVRFDRELGERVTFDEKRSENYLRN